jgi:hypothetical protein
MVPQQLPTTSGGMKRGKASALGDRDEGLGQRHPALPALRRPEDAVDARREVDGGCTPERRARKSCRGRPRDRLDPARHQIRTDHLAHLIERPAQCPVAEDGPQDVSQKERKPGDRFDPCPPTGQAGRNLLLGFGVLEMAKLLHEHARVDLHRTRPLTRAVASARLYGIVLVFGDELFLDGDPGSWRIISRRRAIRCLGVVVRWRLRQTGSQYPHSMQSFATDSISGSVCVFFR